MLPRSGWFWIILRSMEWLEEHYPPGYVKIPENSYCHIWRIVPLKKLGVTKPSTYTYRGGDVFPEWKFKQQQYSPRKQREIIFEFHVLPLQYMGHYVVKCPSPTSNTPVGSQSLQFVLAVTQTTNDTPATDIINQNWILADTCYSVSSIINRDPVQYICAYDAGKEL